MKRRSIKRVFALMLSFAMVIATVHVSMDARAEGALANLPTLEEVERHSLAPMNNLQILKNK